MSYQSLFCYTWDLKEDGVARIAREFQERHINAITLACAYHAGKFLRPHGRDGKVYFPEDGTVYFKTDPSRYGAIQPLENSQLAASDVLHQCCEQPNMATTAWLVLMHNSTLGALHVDDCVTNAFGDSYIYNLCPSSPNARHYAVALCRDVTDNYEVDGITLETPGFLPFQHGYHHEFALVKPNPWLDQRLGLCFCHHCCQQASADGIDMAALKQRVARDIDDYLQSAVDWPDDMAAAFVSADILLDPDLAALLKWRCDRVTSLVAEIRGEVRNDAAVAVIPSVSRPTSAAWYEGSDVKALAEVADYVEACFYEPSVARIESDLADIKRRLGGTEKLRGVLRPAFPDFADADSVAQAVDCLRNADVNGISFYNYGHLKTASLDWMRDALAGGRKSR
jgi:hypothetical protein